MLCCICSHLLYLSASYTCAYLLEVNQMVPRLSRQESLPKLATLGSLPWPAKICTNWVYVVTDSNAINTNTMMMDLSNQYLESCSLSSMPLCGSNEPALALPGTTVLPLLALSNTSSFEYLFMQQLRPAVSRTRKPPIIQSFLRTTRWANSRGLG